MPKGRSVLGKVLDVPAEAGVFTEFYGCEERFQYVTLAVATA